MTGHLEDSVWAINPLLSSKAGSGCEVKPGWKGQAVLSICVLVPGGTERHLHASLLSMGIFISPWGAAPTWRLFPRTGTAGMTGAPHGEGKGQESNSSSWHRKGEGFCPALPHGTTNSSVVTWSSSYTTSFHFPGLSRGGCSQIGRSGFFNVNFSVCPFRAWPVSCLAPSPFHISAAGI